MDDGEHSKLFVGGISWETTEDVLKDHFAKYGPVLGSVIARDRITGSPRGFAFVTFSESSAVDRALQDSHQILTRTVEVKRAIPRNEQHSQQLQQRGVSRNNVGTNTVSNNHFRTKKIFVGGLSASLTQDEFRTYFEKFGRITDVVVMHDNNTHRPRGFGFITFDSEDSVEEVMQKNFHQLSGKLAEVKRAVPKDGINTNGNSYIGRLGAGQSPNNVNSYQQGSYSPYSPYHNRFGHFPSGYGNVAGYPYGTGIFGSSYPSGSFAGIGYGFTPVVPTGPWNPAMVAVRGGLLPYGSAPPIYPAYPNGGYGMPTGLVVNGYGGIVGTGFGEKSGQIGTGDTQNGSDSSLSQTGMNNVDVNSFRSGRSVRASAGKRSQKGNDRSYQGNRS